jgi:hypothetical protein
MILEAKPMVIELEEYESASDMIEAVDEEIANVRNRLGEYLGRLYRIRGLADRSVRTGEATLRLDGKTDVQEIPSEVSIGGLTVVLDANPFKELKAIEEVIRSEQDRLLDLEKAREALKRTDQIDEIEQFKFLVLRKDKAPEKILLKIP